MRSRRPPAEMECTDASSDDDEDEAAELMRELEKIKKERLAQKEKEVRHCGIGPAVVY